ncbi:MAG: insulinase family protein [Arcobacter sp.]|nr:insulinase family protein [Arcobacter sp.]
MSATTKHIKVKDINIPVIYEEQKNLPTLNLQLVFQNSGYIKDKDKNGLASISSQILNEGTKKLGSVKFAQKLEENAISIHTTNGFETFVIELSSLKDVSKKAITYLKDLLKEPNFTEDTLEKLKTIKKGSLKRKENDFDYVSKNLLNSVLFKDTALEKPSSGTISSIDKIKLEDIKEFIKENINLSNLIVVVGGDFSFDEIEKLIKPALKVLQEGRSSQIKQISVKSKNQEKTLIKDTQQAYIYFGSSFNTTAKDKDNYMAKVASFILGGSGFGSRLMEEIRVKRGLAYSAYSYISINKSHSYFTGYLQTKNESYKQAVYLVKSLVKDFVKDGVTQEELDSAKSFLLGSEPLRNETLSQRLNRAFHLYYKGLDPNYSKIELEKIQNLKLDDLNKYIKSHKEIDNLNFAIVKNKL